MYVVPSVIQMSVSMTNFLMSSLVPIEKNLIVAIPAMLFLDVVVIRELSFLPMLNFEHRRGVGRKFGIYFQLLLFLG